jgi:hypothetical protein
MQQEFASDGASILLPLGSLRLLKRLNAMTSGRVTVMIGDKGYSTPAEMRGNYCSLCYKTLRIYSRTTQYVL